MNYNDALKDLRDITGIDSISWWPLAPGWWLMLIITATLVSYLLYKITKYFAFKNSWRYTIYNKMIDIEKSPDSMSSIAAISKYLRLVNIKKFGRTDCAALTGKDWIKWLQDHDPSCYDWRKHEEILLSNYSGSKISEDEAREHILEMVDALKRWLKK